MSINTGPLRAPTGPLPAVKPTLAAGSPARPAPAPQAAPGPQATTDRWQGQAGQPSVPTDALPVFSEPAEELSSAVPASRAAQRDQALRTAQDAQRRGDLRAARAAFDLARTQDPSVEGVLTTCRAAYLAGRQDLATQYEHELHARLIARAAPALAAHQQELAAAARGLNGTEPDPTRMTALLAALTPKVAASISPGLEADIIKVNDYAAGRDVGFHFAPPGSPEQSRAQAVLDRIAPGHIAIVRDGQGTQAGDNAVATGSRFVYIDKGMFHGLNNDDQLAAVLGHELSHAAHKDARADIATELLTTAIPKLVSPRLHGLPRPEIQERLSSINDQITVGRLALSRRQESAADRDGIRLSAHAGYDPRQDVILLQGMANDETARGIVDDTLLDHPLSSKRAADLLGQIAAEHLDTPPRPR